MGESSLVTTLAHHGRRSRSYGQQQHDVYRLHFFLQVLNVSGNRLRSLPADIGWLTSLKQLMVVENPDLHIPIHVLQQGFR